MPSVNRPQRPAPASCGKEQRAEPRLGVRSALREVSLQELTRAGTVPKSLYLCPAHGSDQFAAAGGCGGTAMPGPGDRREGLTGGIEGGFMKPHMGPASAGERESFMTPNDKVGGQGFFPTVSGKAEGPIDGMWGPFTRRGGWTGEESGFRDRSGAKPDHKEGMPAGKGTGRRWGHRRPVSQPGWASGAAKAKQELLQAATGLQARRPESAEKRGLSGLRRGKPGGRRLCFPETKEKPHNFPGPPAVAASASSYVSR